MKKIVCLLTIILILTANNVFSVGEVTNPTQDLSQLEIKSLVIEQNAKSTSEIKEYFERKTIDYNKNTQRMIDENFKVLDARQDQFLREAGFKLGAVFLSGLVLGQLIVLLIKRKIEKQVIIKKNLWDGRHRENIVMPLEEVIKKQEEKYPEQKEQQKNYELPKVEDLPKQKNPKIRTDEKIINQQKIAILDVKKHIIPSMSDSQ